jgi:hypothetical protein
MELDQLRENIAAEILALRQAIANREDQINSLTEANQTARERIDQLRDAEAAIESTLSKLNEIGPLSSARGRPKKAAGRGPLSEGGAKVRLKQPSSTIEDVKLPRGHIRETIILLLTNAGSSGMSIEEIADHYERQYNRQLKPASVRTLLYQAAHDGVTERQEDGTWRIRTPARQLEAAE